MKVFSRSKLDAMRYMLIAVFLLASFFRFFGLNWDRNHHLHPDERFLTMVSEAVSWPKSISEYLNPQISPLNPYNVNYGFFVYGTLPLKIVKAAAEFIKFKQFDYNNITLVGRFISALFDLGIVLLVFKIGQKIFNEKIGLLSCFLYAISVLPIQLSHFYAVDSFLVFFLTISFYLLILLISQYPNILVSIFLGASFGLALACKISALLFLPIIGLGFIFTFLKNKDLRLFTINCLLFTIFSYLTLRVTDPRLFASSNFFNLTINPQFIDNIKKLQSFGNPESLFPPAIQWLKTKAIIFPLKNIILWGLGLPLGILTLGGILYSFWRNYLLIKSLIKSKFQQLNNRTIEQYNHLLILLWPLLLFLYQGLQFAKPMRYFYPLYPFLAILAANFLYQLANFLNEKIKSSFILYTLYFILLPLLLGWPLSFLSIYSRPHSRVTASQWIYENIPPGATISCEHWDDCLPLGLGDKSHQLYQVETLTLYDPDTHQKWQKIDQQLGKIDYLIMSSNRLWGSIPRVPERYPQTTKFYQDLFAERLQFKKVAEITSYPTIPILNIQISDDSADESFTVYDHPQVLIFQKTN